MIKSGHWEEIYASRPADEVGWYRPHLQTSITWISELGLSLDAPIIDVGGGASTLVDDLLGLGYKSLTVLDLAEQAIAVTKERLGESAKSVTWLHADITEITLPQNRYLLWHDRAVFHFLLEHGEQQNYINAMLRAIRPNGYFIIGVFGPEAPAQCSGLPVQRYTPELLCEKFAPEFELLRQQNEIHETPSGVEQAYVYCLFRRTA